MRLTSWCKCTPVKLSPLWIKVESYDFTHKSTSTTTKATRSSSEIFQNSCITSIREKKQLKLSKKVAWSYGTSWETLALKSTPRISTLQPMSTWIRIAKPSLRILWAHSRPPKRQCLLQQTQVRQLLSKLLLRKAKIQRVQFRSKKKQLRRIDLKPFPTWISKKQLNTILRLPRLRPTTRAYLPTYICWISTSLSALTLGILSTASWSSRSLI